MGRTALTDNTSWGAAYDRATFTADALGIAVDAGDKALAPHGKRLEALIARWGQLDLERRARRRAVSRCHALVRSRDFKADQAVRALHVDTMAEVKQDRASALYVALFPDGVFAVTKLALESEMKPLRGLVRTLEAEAPAALTKGHLKPIESAIADGEAAIREREEAFAELGRTSARISGWKEDANALLLGVEGALQTLAADRKLGREWVDTFFPQASAKRGGAKADDDDGETPSAPAAPTNDPPVA